MREHLFRGKRIDNGEWAEGDLFHDRDCFGNITGSWIYEFDKAHGRMFQQEIDPATVGEYTGLLDKNGKRIFEGDVVSFSVFDFNGADTQWQGVIKFEEGRWEIWNSAESEYYGADGCFFLWDVRQQDEEMEVIGNIHDQKGDRNG